MQTKLKCINFLTIIFLTLLYGDKKCCSYKILILNPFGSKSLYILASAIGEALVDGGHEVTVLNSFSNSSRYKYFNNC